MTNLVTLNLKAISGQVPQVVELVDSDEEDDEIVIVEEKTSRKSLGVKNEGETTVEKKTQAEEFKVNNLPMVR